jgi:uncharacterized protein
VSNRVFIDTLFVIALVNPNDQHHARALELAEEYEGHPLVVTDAVLLEIGNGLARKFKQQAIEVIEQFFASDEIEIVTLTSDLFHRGFSVYKSRQDKEWGLVDCISFEVMRDAGITAALTVDHHFVQAGFYALMREGKSGK